MIWLKKAIHDYAYKTELSKKIAKRKFGLRIIMFHQIGTKEYPYRIFSNQIHYIAKHFKVISMDDAIIRLRNKSRDIDGVVLTFDDGLSNNARLAAPLLNELKIPAIFYVCPSLIIKKQWLWNHEMRCRLLSIGKSKIEEVYEELKIGNSIEEIIEHAKQCGKKEQEFILKFINKASESFKPSMEQKAEFSPMSLEELKSLGSFITVGSHSTRHKILTGLSKYAQKAEILCSKKMLEKLLNKSVNHFCFPNGAYDEYSLKIVKENFVSAVSTSIGIVTNNSDIYKLPRIPASYDEATFVWRLHRPNA